MGKKLSAYNLHMKRELKGKMKGKTKAQRKAIFKAAARKWKSKSKGAKSKSRSKPKSGGSRSSRSRSSSTTGGKTRVGNTFNTSKIFSLITKAALVAPFAAVALGPGTPEQKIRTGVYVGTGYNMQDGSFSWDRVQRTYTPYVVARILQAGIPRIGSFIKGLMG